MIDFYVTYLLITNVYWSIIYMSVGHVTVMFLVHADPTEFNVPFSVSSETAASAAGSCMFHDMDHFLSVNTLSIIRHFNVINFHGHETTTFWTAMDTDLSETMQYHFVFFDFRAYSDVSQTIGDDAVNLIDDGDVAAVHRLQTWITIHYFDPSDLLESVGTMHRSLLQLREDHETLLQRFETWREHTSRLMEWVASNDASMAGPLGLLLRPADLQPDEAAEPTAMSRSTSAGT